MGAERQERAERRLMAILAADVVGYSRLMGADEEGTHERLKTVRRQVTDPKIEEHRGRIVKTTGDGLLVEFASVVDAVRCAVDVQREMALRNLDIEADKRIAFRIGINLGDVIIDETDIFGDGVNVAARLEPLAQPGGICVSRIVRDQVRDKLGFGFEDMGERQVKNIARPVHIYRVALDGRLGDALTPQAAAPAPASPAAAAAPAGRTGRSRFLAIAAVGGIAVLGGAAAISWWQHRAAPPNPVPVIGGPVLFERDQVVLLTSAGDAIAVQAKFLHDNPEVKVAIVASCAKDEGAPGGAWVLAQLRANRVRDALEAQGVAGERMTTENGCKTGATAKLPAEVAAARDGQVFVLWK